MAIVQWTKPDEVSGADRLRHEVDRLFNAFLGGAEPFISHAYPALSITEDTGNFYARAELPGVVTEDLEISVVEGRLIIRGERKVQVESPEANYHRRERESGLFRRAIALPARVATDKVSASVKNGVLMVVLPKAEEAKPRKITVKTA